QRHGFPQFLEQVRLELVRRAVPGVVDLGLGCDDGIEELALTMLRPGLGVGPRHRDRLAKGAAPLRRDHDQARARRALEDELPLLRREVGLCGHPILPSGVWILPASLTQARSPAPAISRLVAQPAVP